MNFFRAMKSAIMCKGASSKQSKFADAMSVFRLFCTFSARLLLLGVLPLHLSGEVIRIPYYIECTSLSEVEKDQLKARLSLETSDICGAIKIGIVPEGEHIDMSLPPNYFLVQYNLWIKKWESSLRKNSLDYEEVIQFDKTANAFEALAKWVSKVRKGEVVWKSKP